MEKDAEVDCRDAKAHCQQDGAKESRALGPVDHGKADEGAKQEDARKDGGGEPASAQG